MKRLISCTVVAFALMTSSVWAGPDCGKGAHAKAAKSGCPQEKIDGAVAKVMSTLPAMTYKAGDVETPCFKTATAKAGCESKVGYIVSGNYYTDKASAMNALADELEKKAESMSRVQFAVGDKNYNCPVTAKGACNKGDKVAYTLAGFHFDSQEKAQEVATMLASTQKVANKAGCGAACDKSKTVATSGKAKGCCPTGTATVATAKSGCDKGVTSVASTASGCDKAKTAGSATVAAKTSGCNKAKTAGNTTVADKVDPQQQAEQRVASVQNRIRQMVQTAAGKALSS